MRAVCRGCVRLPLGLEPPRPRARRRSGRRGPRATPAGSAGRRKGRRAAPGRECGRAAQARPPGLRPSPAGPPGARRACLQLPRGPAGLQPGGKAPRVPQSRLLRGGGGGAGRRDAEASVLSLCFRGRASGRNRAPRELPRRRPGPQPEPARGAADPWAGSGAVGPGGRTGRGGDRNPESRPRSIGGARKARHGRSGRPCFPLTCAPRAYRVLLGAGSRGGKSVGFPLFARSGFGNPALPCISQLAP